MITRVFRAPLVAGFLLAITALTGLCACGGSEGIPGDAVVQVGGNPITKVAYEHWITVAATSSAKTTTGKPAKPVIPVPPAYTACIAHLGGQNTKELATTRKKVKSAKPATTAQLKSECAQQYTSLKQEVLGFLISSEWVFGEAASLRVKVRDAEVKKRFAQIKSKQFPKPADFEKYLGSAGETVSDLLLRVRLNMLSGRIQQEAIKNKGNVTEAQIKKYYNENKSRFGTPEKRNIQVIVTKTEAAASSAKKEVQSGKNFTRVAKSRSVEPTSKATGGMLIGVFKGQEEKALDEAAFSAKKGVLSGPIKTPSGFYIFEVTKTTPGTQQSFSQAKASIKQQLTATQQQTALSDFVKNYKKKWIAKTDCRTGYVIQDCSNYKAPKIASATPSGTGTK